MKKIIFIVLVIILVISCKKQTKVNYALISGEVMNSNGKILVIKDRSKVKQITVKEDGTFKDTIKNAEGYYTLAYSRKITPLYLKNGYDLQINLDTKQPDKTLVYFGKGNEVNNYLTKMNFLKNSELGKDLYTLNEEEFLAKLNSVKFKIKEELKGLDKDFVKKEQKKLRYEYALALLNYQKKQRLLRKEENIIILKKNPIPTEGIDLTNEEDFKSFDSYKQLVINTFLNEIENEKDKAKIVSEKLKKIREGSIKKVLMEKIIESIEDANEENLKLYDVLIGHLKDEELKVKLKKSKAFLKKIIKGNPSPTFKNYENYKGGTSSLKNFKGKYVYIDVWATWCGPCESEIPYMKRLEKQYSGKNIVFISISVDYLNNKNGWKKMVKEKQMGGVQLFSDKNWKSDFVKNYQINSIPRFIFLDTKGNIINANAPRPSDLRLVELFKEYGL